MPDTNRAMWLSNMVDRIRCALLESGGRGVISVNVDGTSVSYSQEQGLSLLRQYERELAIEMGTLQRTRGINLG